MNRHHNQVPVSRVLAALALAVGGVAALVGFAYLLVPRAETLRPLAAPGEADAAPGELVCPAPADLPAADPLADVSAGELIDCPAIFDGRRVVYVGEVIDAVLPRGNRAWVQLNDDPYSGEAGPLPQSRTALGGNSGIAVSIPREAAQRVDHVGSYRAQGDVLRVMGRYHAADPADGGAPAIQADQVRIVRPGHDIAHRVSSTRVVAAIALSLVALAVALMLRRTRDAAA